MKLEKIQEHKQISSQLKAKSYESETALTLEILTSGMHPKAIIILSFFLLLKANRMPFNKYELAKRLKLSEYSSQKYSKILVDLGLLKRDLEYSKAGNTAFYSIFEFDIKSEDNQKSNVVLPSQAIVKPLETPTSSFSYEKEEKEGYACEKPAGLLAKNVLNKIKNNAQSALNPVIVEETPNAGDLQEDKKLNEPFEPRADGSCEDLQKNDLKQALTKNEICEDIINYLNLKARKGFKHIPANYRGINARLKEGNTIDDIKRVIDSKCEEWGHVEKMRIYLRPDTLFSPGKFEAYLQKVNEAKPKIVEKDGDDDDSFKKFRIEILKDFYLNRDYGLKKDGKDFKGHLSWISLEGDRLVLEFKDLEDYDNIIPVSFDDGILKNKQRFDKLKDSLTECEINKR